jgi:hypothetical protein
MNTMFIQDVLICLQLSVDCLTAKHPSDCLSKPLCGCAHPGKELQCEDCEHLEACLSRFQPLQSHNDS